MMMMMKCKSKTVLAVFAAFVAVAHGAEQGIRGAGNLLQEGRGDGSMPPENWTVSVFDSRDELGVGDLVEAERELSESEDEFDIYQELSGPVDDEEWEKGPGPHLRFLATQNVVNDVLDDILKVGWHNISTQDLVVLILGEIQEEVRVNKTFDPTTAIVHVVQQVVAKAPEDFRNDTALMEGLIEDLTTRAAEFPPERTLQKAVLEAEGESVCRLEGECNTTKHQLRVESIISAMLMDYKRQGVQPNMTAIYERVDSDVGLDANAVDDLIESNPELSKYIKDKAAEVETAVYEKEVEEDAQKLTQKLTEAAENMTTVLETLQELDMKVEDVAALLQSAKNETAEGIIKAMNLPDEKLQQNIQKAQENNHSHYEDTGEEEVDEETGERRRILQWVPHPSKLSMDDHIKAAEDRVRRRRLSRMKRLPDHSAFERRLREHGGHLQGHVRRLREACDSSDTKIRCMADGLEELSDEVNEVIPKVLEELDPLKRVIDALQTGSDILDLLVKGGTLTYYAVQGCEQIPKVGPFFKPVRIGMKPVLDIMKKIEEKLEKFVDMVADVWEKSIGFVENILKSFNAGSIGLAVQGTKAVATVQESQCLTGIVNDVVGFDLISGVEIPAIEISKYLDMLSVALGGLMKVFLSVPWQIISAALNAVILAFEPIREFFRPFDPLIDIMKMKVTINPWFNVPYPQKILGEALCENGFHKKFDGRSCWENGNRDWAELTPKVMQVTCAYGGMSDRSIPKTCHAPSYGRGYRRMRDWCRWIYISYPYTCYERRRTCRRWLGCWTWYQPRLCWGSYSTYQCIRYAGGCDWGYSAASWMPTYCVSNCASGYSGWFGTCYKHCPSGYTSTLLGVCVRSRIRIQETRSPQCDHHTAAEGTHPYFNIASGKCHQSCKPGDTNVVAGCLPPVSLRISIEDIWDAFQFIVDLIEKHPFIQLVKLAIEVAVMPHLKDILDLIEDWLKKGLGLTDLPTINAAILPFDLFNDISISIPNLPDVSFLANLPKNMFDALLDLLPDPIDGIFFCGTDFDCILPELDIDVPNIIDPILNFLEGVEISFDALEQLGDGIGCHEWSKVTVPISDIMDKVGLPDVPACDTDIHWCSKPDFSNVVGALQTLQKTVVDTAKEHWDKTFRGRRLADEEDKYFHLISFPLNAIAEESNLDEMLRSWEGFVGISKSEKEPIATYVRVELDRQISVGLLLRDGDWSLGLSASGGIRARAMTMIGAKDIISKAMEAEAEVSGFSEVLEADLSWCADDDECSEVYADIEEHLDMAGKGSWPKCTSVVLEELETALYEKKETETEDPKAGAQVRQAVSCLEYWFEQRKGLEDLLYQIKRFHPEKVEKGTGSEVAVASDSNKEKSKLMKLTRFVPTLESAGIMDLVGVDLGSDRSHPDILNLALEQADHSGVRNSGWHKLINDFEDNARFTLGLDAEGLGPFTTVSAKFFYEHFNGNDWKDALSDMGSDLLAGLHFGGFDLPESLLKGEELQKVREMSNTLSEKLQTAKQLLGDAEKSAKKTHDDLEESKLMEEDAAAELAEKQRALANADAEEEEEAQTEVQKASEKLEKINLATEKLAKLLFNKTLAMEEKEKEVVEAQDEKEKVSFKEKFFKFLNGLDKGITVGVTIQSDILDSREWFSPEIGDDDGGNDNDDGASGDDTKDYSV